MINYDRIDDELARLGYELLVYEGKTYVTLDLVKSQEIVCVGTVEKSTGEVEGFSYPPEIIHHEMVEVLREEYYKNDTQP